MAEKLTKIFTLTFHIFWMFLAGAPALQTLRVWPFWDLPSCCFGNSSNHWLADLFRFADFCCSLLFKQWSTPLQTGWDWHCFSHDRFAVFWLSPVAFAFPYWQTPDCGNVLNWTSHWYPDSCYLCFGSEWNISVRHSHFLFCLLCAYELRL